jgi:hypothetical protein
MPFLVPIAGVIVKRGAFKITPEADVPFEFTDEEAAKFLASPNPVVRELIVEIAPMAAAPAAPAKRTRKTKTDDDEL